MALEIVPVGLSRRERKRFIQIEFDLQGRDPNWAPPLRFDRLGQMDPDKNPFFEHATVQHLIAVRDGRDVGRIAFIVNDRHNEFHEEKTAHFGFFEAVDGETTRALLEDALRRAAEAGMDRLLGPVSYSTNDVCGLLIEGFDSPPAILMPHNPPTYGEWIEAAGFTKAKDLLAFYVDQTNERDPRLEKIAQRRIKKLGLVFRQMDMKRYDDEVALIRDLYNRGWEKNWGFVPMTDAELNHMAKELRPVIDPRLVVFAEVDGEVAGFALAVPDLNRILVNNRSGRLFPFGLIRLLRGKGKLVDLRLLTLGVLPEFRRKGIDAALIHGVVQRWTALGFFSSDCSWVLEDNTSMIAGMQTFGGEVTKRYRLYERKA